MKLYIIIAAALTTAKLMEYSTLSILEWLAKRRLARAYEAKRSEIEGLAGEAWKRQAAKIKVGDELHDAGLD